MRISNRLVQIVGIHSSDASEGLISMLVCFSLSYNFFSWHRDLEMAGYSKNIFNSTYVIPRQEMWVS